jgi:hypothetical protein
MNDNTTNPGAAQVFGGARGGSGDTQSSLGPNVLGGQLVTISPLQSRPRTISVTSGG